MDTIHKKIFDILKEIKNEIPDDFSADLLSFGIIDSFDIVEVIGTIENSFLIEIAAEDIIPENLCSINNLANLVSKYLKK